MAMTRDRIIKRLEMADNWLHLTDQQRYDIASLFCEQDEHARKIIEYAIADGDLSAELLDGF